MLQVQAQQYVTPHLHIGDCYGDVQLIHCIVTAFSARFRPPHRTIPRTMDKREACSPLRSHNPAQADQLFTDKSRPHRSCAGHPSHLLAKYDQSPRDRYPRLQDPPATSRSHKESHESRPRSKDDISRSTDPFCQGLRHLHHGANNACLDTC